MQKKRKRKIVRIFIVANIVIFSLIIALSVVILCLTYSMKNENSNNKAYLYSSQSEHSNAVNHTLIFVKKNTIPVVNDEILFVKKTTDKNIQCVDTIYEITESKILFSDGFSISTNSNDYLGKVTSKNEFFGKIIFKILEMQNEFLIYVVIVLLFLVVTAFVMNLYVQKYKITCMSKRKSNKKS
ncbi:MAG: hypothetical protein RSA99_00985 [Oscillospiraceae bacterium]